MTSGLPQSETGYRKLLSIAYLLSVPSICWTLRSLVIEFLRGSARGSLKTMILVVPVRELAIFGPSNMISKSNNQYTPMFHAGMVFTVSSCLHIDDEMTRTHMVLYKIAMIM